MRERNKGVTEIPINVTQMMDSVTNDSPDVTQDVTLYSPVVYALADPIKRMKLEHIIEAHHKNRGLLELTRYGASGPTLDVVAEMLEVT